MRSSGDADEETSWGMRFRWSSCGRSHRWPQWKTQVSDVSTGHPRSHHLPRTPRGCPQGAKKETPRGLGVRSRVPAGVPLLALHKLRCCREPLQPQTLHTLRSSLGRTGLCLCACAPVLGESTLVASSRTLRFRRGRASGPSQRRSVALIIRLVRGAR